MKNLLVLGLGNDILSDDGVGIEVVRRLKKRFHGIEGIDFIETNEMGLSLLDFLAGYNHAIIVDSIITGRHKPGTILIFDRGDFNLPSACNPHHMGLDEILDLAEKTGIPIPEKIHIVAIEVSDPFTFSEGLTPEVKKALPGVLDTIEKIIRDSSPS